MGHIITSLLNHIALLHYKATSCIIVEGFCLQGYTERVSLVPTPQQKNVYMSDHCLLINCILVFFTVNYAFSKKVDSSVWIERERQVLLFFIEQPSKYKEKSFGFLLESEM